MRVLFNAAEIAARVNALAAEIARTIPDDFVIVGLLKSAAVFVADLAGSAGETTSAPRSEKNSVGAEPSPASLRSPPSPAVRDRG
jgi:hypothetical protein